MAKKKATKKEVKPTEQKTVGYDYLLAQLTEDRNAICKLANQLQADIGKVNDRIDRIVAAIVRSKNIKGM